MHIIFRKTILDIFRDSTTYITLFISCFAIPVFFGGLILFVGASDNTITVGVDRIALDNFNVLSYLYDLPKDISVNIETGDDLRKRLESNKLNCYITANGNNELLFVYNSRSYNSFTAASRVGQAIQLKYFEDLSKEKNIISMRLVDENDAENGIANSVINIFLPIILVFIFSRGMSYYADDLFAGEKERKTLEWLIISTKTRSSIYLGKIGALLCLNLLNSIIGFFSFDKTLDIINKSLLSFHATPLHNSSITFVLCGAIALSSISVLISIISSYVSIISPSIHESQVINTIVSAMPVIITFLLTTSSAVPHFIIYFPFLGTIKSVVDICSGNIIVKDCLFSALSQILLISIIAVLSIKQLNSEKTIMT